MPILGRNKVFCYIGLMLNIKCENIYMPILLLFDIDGTLVRFRDGKSKELFSVAMKNIFGTEISEDMMPDFQGQTDLKILQLICHKFGFSYQKLLDDIDNIWEMMYDMFKDFADEEHLKLLPGINTLLHRLSASDDFQCALLTGNFEKNAYLKLSPWGIDKLFPFGAFGSDHQDRNKLLPIAIDRANRYWGEDVFNLNNTIIIGDSHMDIECARSNGIPVVSVATGWLNTEKLEELKPDVVLDTLENTDEVISVFYNLVKSEH